MLFALFMLLLTGVGYSQTKNFIDQPYIEVNGGADTLVTPNEIFIRILLSEKDTRDKVSIEELEQKMVNSLRSLGLNTDKDLTTIDMASNYKYYFLKSRDVIKTKSYTIKVTEAVMATKVFITLEELGISNAYIDRVNHSDLANLKNAMRTKAIIDARERALALTKPLNQNIGSAIHIVDAENYGSQLEGITAGIRIRGNSSMNENYVGDLPKIDFEKIKITANINATFVLR